MVRQSSKLRPGGRFKRLLGGDWPIYVAFLPAILACAAIAITAAMALSSTRHLSPANSPDMKIMPGGDDYVEGLAKLGIAKLPNHGPAAVIHSGRGGGPLPSTQLARRCVRLG